MKTKLLRRVRKHYSIVYYPNGVRYKGSVYNKK